MQNTSRSERSQENANREKTWDENPFHCSPEWHLASMKSRFAPILYSWGRGLSFKTDSFFAAIDNIAKYFDVDRKTVMEALKELVECGWAEVTHKEPGKPVTYRFVDHEEWAREHPDKCIEKATMPWEDDGDPLGQQLHAISGGLAKFYTNQMTGLRKSGLPDQRIATEWRIFLGGNPQTGRQWKGVYFRFRKHLLQVADDLRDAANAKNSSSRESAGTDTYQSAGTDTPSRLW